MNATEWAAFFHHLLSYTLFSCVVVQHLMLTPELSFTQAKRIKVVNKILYFAVALLLVVGLSRVFFYEKGATYYSKNWLFHAKTGLFVLFVLLTIYPSKCMCAWKSALAAGTAPTLSKGTCKGMLMCMRLELLIMVFIILCATLMAHGVGVIVPSTVTP